MLTVYLIVLLVFLFMRQLSLVSALVLSLVDYCNSSLAGLPPLALAPLQVVLS